MLKETLDNLKNKIEYKIHTFAYDPAANEYVKENKQKQQPEGLTIANQNENADKSKQEENKDTSDTPSKIKTATGTDDPDTFSFKRFMKRFWQGFTGALKWGIIPFFALMMAMIIANDLIVYPAPLRVIGFVLTFFITLINPIALIGIILYYAGVGAYGYIQNRKLPDDKKLMYLPQIFALLPVLVQDYNSTESSSKLMNILSYPFKYPKTAENASQLPTIMKQYLEENEKSFSNFDTYKNREPFASAYNDLKQSILTMHESASA